MSWTPPKEEIEAILAADSERRYEYFITHVYGSKKVWGLYHDGWATLEDGTAKYLPFWPHKIFAARFKNASWEAYIPKEIALDEFLERWLPGMKREGFRPAIFPVEAGKCITGDLDDFEEHLRHGLQVPRDE